MAESNDLAIGYAMGQDSNGGNNSGWGGAWEGIWGIIILAMVFGWGNNGFGGLAEAATVRRARLHVLTCVRSSRLTTSRGLSAAFRRGFVTVHLH